MKTMKVGDILTDNSDKKWIIFDLDLPHVYVVDFSTQQNRYILLPEEVKSVESKPSNVEWLFMRRREVELQDVKEYL